MKDEMCVVDKQGEGGFLGQRSSSIRGRTLFDRADLLGMRMERIRADENRLNNKQRTSEGEPPNRCLAHPVAVPPFHSLVARRTSPRHEPIRSIRLIRRIRISSPGTWPNRAPILRRW